MKKLILAFVMALTVGSVSADWNSDYWVAYNDFNNNNSSNSYGYNNSYGYSNIDYEEFGPFAWGYYDGYHNDQMYFDMGPFDFTWSW
jgi:hypothetical protein